MGQSGVTKDIPSGSIVWGLPAMPQKKYKQINAALRRLPQTTARFREVEKLLAEIQVHLGKSV